MKTTATREKRAKNGSPTSAAPVEVLSVYLEKNPIVQAVIRDLVKILRNGDLPTGERQWAETALGDALFHYQSPKSGKRGRIVPAQKVPRPAGVKAAHDRMEGEEKEFAAKLARLLKEKEVSQTELANRVGVGRSAISMMLSRHCRPQRRTLEKIAHALDVPLQALWPA
jgi:DNA-binding Xre family transcriptional regulator